MGFLITCAVMDDQIIQVPDDIELLRLMLEDARRAPADYQPTNFWAVYENQFIPELERHGLRDFRRREQSVLHSFGAAISARRPPLNYALLSCLPRGVKQVLRERVYRTAYYQGKRRQALVNYCAIADEFGRSTGARPLTSVSASRAGNPHEIAPWKGHWYDVEFLHFYMFYAWAQQFVPMDRIGTYVELGGGLGLQVLVMKQLFPDMTCLLFDLPSQLYVCEQYLKSVFPGRVISYRDARSLSEPGMLQSGCIHMFGAYQLPMISRISIDLFWNANSFQEMEPDVVENYAGLVRHAKYVVLREMLRGQAIAARAGEPGVLRRTGYAHYTNYFAPTHEVLSMEPSVHLEHVEMVRQFYIDSVWKRRQT